SASIDAQGATSGVEVVSGSVSGLDLFGAQGGYGFLGTAISALDADITDCTLRDCDRALTADGAFSVRMRGCSIERTGGILTSSCNGSLDIRDCVFTDNTSLDASVVTVLATVTCTSELFVSGCEFVRSPAFDFGTPTVGWEGAVQATVTGNLFRDNAAAAAGPTVFTVPKAGPRGSRAGGSIVEISSNTIARLDAAGIIGKLPPGSSIHANAVTGCVQGVQLAEMTGVSFTCNLVWGNGQNYVGGPDLTGTDGNLSEPPKYCDPDAGDFTVAANSPLLPGGNSCGVPIGAFGEGCGDVSVEPSSWGRIKGLYRE
ncbi:hypothetical protein K8I85_10230, partial [bacterium]|nr:hypothetical protein [bacterium]